MKCVSLINWTIHQIVRSFQVAGYECTASDLITNLGLGPQNGTFVIVIIAAHHLRFNLVDLTRDGAIAEKSVTKNIEARLAKPKEEQTDFMSRIQKVLPQDASL